MNVKKRYLLPFLFMCGCYTNVAYADETLDTLSHQEEELQARLSEAQTSLLLADASVENVHAQVTVLQNQVKEKPTSKASMKQKIQYQANKAQLVTLLNEQDKIESARKVRKQQVDNVQKEIDTVKDKMKQIKEQEAEKAQATQAVNAPEVNVPSTPAPQVSTQGQWVDGLRPQTVQARNHLQSVFPQVTIGGYRPGDTDGVGTGHGDGLALDLMVPVSSALGDSIAQYVIDHYNELHVSYIIWKQRFWAAYPNIYGPANTWDWMPDRGSITQNHYDHVHISFAR